ncbi:MAG: hypothetical protein ACKVU2_01825 [Saprospiraceae bacterium]
MEVHFTSDNLLSGHFFQMKMLVRALIVPVQEKRHNPVIERLALRRALF